MSSLWHRQPWDKQSSRPSSPLEPHESTYVPVGRISRQDLLQRFQDSLKLIEQKMTTSVNANTLPSTPSHAWRIYDGMPDTQVQHSLTPSSSPTITLKRCAEFSLYDNPINPKRSKTPLSPDALPTVSLNISETIQRYKSTLEFIRRNRNQPLSFLLTPPYHVPPAESSSTRTRDAPDTTIADSNLSHTTRHTHTTVTDAPQELRAASESSQHKQQTVNTRPVHGMASRCGTEDILEELLSGNVLEELSGDNVPQSPAKGRIHSVQEEAAVDPSESTTFVHPPTSTEPPLAATTIPSNPMAVGVSAPATKDPIPVFATDVEEPVAEASEAQWSSETSTPERIPVTVAEVEEFLVEVPEPEPSAATSMTDTTDVGSAAKGAETQPNASATIVVTLPVAIPEAQLWPHQMVPVYPTADQMKFCAQLSDLADPDVHASLRASLVAMLDVLNHPETSALEGAVFETDDRWEMSGKTIFIRRLVDTLISENKAVNVAIITYDVNMETLLYSMFRQASFACQRINAIIDDWDREYGIIIRTVKADTPVSPAIYYSEGIHLSIACDMRIGPDNAVFEKIHGNIGRPFPSLFLVSVGSVEQRVWGHEDQLLNPEKTWVSDISTFKQLVKQPTTWTASRQNDIAMVDKSLDAIVKWISSASHARLQFHLVPATQAQVAQQEDTATQTTLAVEPAVPEVSRAIDAVADRQAQTTAEAQPVTEQPAAVDPQTMQDPSAKEGTVPADNQVAIPEASEAVVQQETVSVAPVEEGGASAVTDVSVPEDETLTLSGLSLQDVAKKKYERSVTELTGEMDMEISDGETPPSFELPPRNLTINVSDHQPFAAQPSLSKPSSPMDGGSPFSLTFELDQQKKLQTKWRKYIEELFVGYGYPFSRRQRSKESSVKRVTTSAETQVATTTTGGCTGESGPSSDEESSYYSANESESDLEGSPSKEPKGTEEDRKSAALSKLLAFQDSPISKYSFRDT
ncbi:uncharacterized protein BYT42DRAFT_579413 [Radiomyces spectabilis]|uniref:uncharacterized protein n=1 Tax=Radiomyces spectabilis TaxID=64574 RepID=UPI002220974B|nr:uncharacterized protein BYT42DRAFT_579413 [Radiomyces spectabilis]KAI8373162.1 hypothetical protein BYT42DRAFT_579413 [Radiomyces spectabilis]